MSKEISLPDLQKKLAKNLTAKRYTHTIGVAAISTGLAMAHGVDTDKAMLAGLLHDCAKCIEEKKQMKLCKKYGIELSKEEEEIPALIHAKLGSSLARYEYEIEDEEILSAIRWHTTGRPEMTMLEKIVYIADYIEPSRKNLPGLDEIRRLAFVDIDRAIITVLKGCLEYLQREGRPIDPVTKETYDYYVKNQE